MKETLDWGKIWFGESRTVPTATTLPVLAWLLAFVKEGERICMLDLIAMPVADLWVISTRRTGVRL